MDQLYFLLNENSFSPNLTITEDNRFKRINVVMEAIDNDLLKKEEDEQQPQQSSFPSFDFKQTNTITTTNTSALVENFTDTSLTEQHTRRTVTFDDDHSFVPSILNLPIHTTNITSRLSNRDPILNEEQQEDMINRVRSSNIPNESDQINVITQDLSNLATEDEYIPGGFVNLDQDLEEELLNDFDDEFDDGNIRRSRYISSLRSSDPVLTIIRSPIELWQRARILIAIHLHKVSIQTRISNAYDNTIPVSAIIDTSIRKISDENKPSNSINETDYLEKIFQQKNNSEDRKITFGLIVIKQFSLDSSQQYQYVDFYDVEQGYIIISNVLDNFKTEEVSLHKKDVTYRSLTQDNCKLHVYAIDRKLLNEIPSVQLDCSFQFDFMICIPIFRLILGFMNMKNHKSLMILIGDVSRKCIFLSKQEISEHIHSVLYIHEISLLFIGCIGRILQYNTQSLQFISQPIFTSELPQLPFHSHESILHMCDIQSHRSIGLLSSRYFLVWQYAPNEKLLLKFCNSFQYDFNRCHHHSKFDYLIFALIDGVILIYQFEQMKRIRRYQCHWQLITDLRTTQNFLLSSSMDHRINVWNLETLQHIYQYNTSKEIFQIDIIHENLFYYRTLQEIILFQLNLHTVLFSVIKTKVRTLKLFNDTQKIARILALLDDYSCVLIPITGCCLTHVPNVAKKPIKQVLHDISRSSIYSLHFDGEIVLYRTHNDPCVAEYKIQSKSEQSTITCMTLINPMRTHLFSLGAMEISTEKSLANQAIFFGHSNGYISLFQGDSLTMEPILAHKTSLVCLETSRASMQMSNISFTNSEILLSCSIDRSIYLWDLNINKSNESIQLIHIITIEQEKNISLESIKFLTMIDNFLVANYSDQKFLHIWQLLNISIQTNDRDRWGIVEHPTKGNHHHSQIQAISAISKLKLFASSDSEGNIKIWDNTNSLLREIHLDSTLHTIEFNSQNGELIIAYQDNLHLILLENYLINTKKFKVKQQMIVDCIAEDNRLEVTPSLIIPYESLPFFDYKIKHHHTKKRLQRFERQLAGRFVVIDSQSSQSDDENTSSLTTDRLSTISDDDNWSNLADDVKDILRMKKYEIRKENK
ncbi:hypothetical protein I4U23_008936 [Adineta vaga]|nr:hypothetical protein I4U23_008936 [Adineta vaga]